MVEVDEHARKHGVADEDMRNAIRHPMRTLEQDEDRTLFIGADRAGRLLEVVVLDDDPAEEPLIIHAMPLRPKFHELLRR
jgi:hypothetical protein